MTGHSFDSERLSDFVESEFKYQALQQDVGQDVASSYWGDFIKEKTDSGMSREEIELYMDGASKNCRKFEKELSDMGVVVYDREQAE